MSCRPNCSRPLYKDGYCRTHSPELQRAARKANPERFKSYTLIRDYRISYADYQELLATQGGCCAICGRQDGNERNNNNGSKRLAVDHDHKTGYVRGLLCSPCNQGLGGLLDSPVLLRKAAEYLEHAAAAQAALEGLADQLLLELTDLQAA